RPADLDTCRHAAAGARLVSRGWRTGLTSRRRIDQTPEHQIREANMNLPPPPQQKQSQAERNTQARARECADVPPPLRPSQQAEEQIAAQAQAKAQAKQEGMTRAEAR